MLGSSVPSTLLTFDSGTQSRLSAIAIVTESGVSLEPVSLSPKIEERLATTYPSQTLLLSGIHWPDLESNSSNSISFNAKRLLLTKNPALTRWKTHLAGRTSDIVLSDEDTKKWEACRQVFSRFQFTTEEEDKILGKAFGLVHSPYWGEEREKIVPEYENIDATIEYLTGLGLSDDDVIKILKKFPEVVGCSLENELKANVQILEKQWGIKGKSLRNLLLRNPKVLGYIIDCKGDCMALCTRCWVRF